MSASSLFAQLKQVVERLAAPAEAQVQFLKEFGTYPSADELGLQFHDFAVSPSRLRSQCGLSNEALSLVASLDEKLNSFSGEKHADLWDASALANSRDWADVRAIAKQLLNALT